PLRIGVARDHQLLAGDALELEPAARALVHVRRVGLLRDQPFPALAARLGEKTLAVLRTMFRITNRIAVTQHPSQQILACELRQRSGAPAVDMEHVEQIEVHRRGGDEPAVRIAYADAALQLREARLLSVEGDDLAVDDEVVAALASQGVNELGIGSADLQAIARQQAHVVAAAQCHAAHAVELALEDPSRVGKMFRGQRREHRCEPARLRLAAKSAALGGRHRAQQRAVYFDDHTFFGERATSSMVRPEITLSVRSLTGSSSGFAALSFILMSSQFFSFSPMRL